jgi:hypothetical protein
VGPSTQLPLIELATPALQELPQDEQARVLQHVEALVQADNQLTLLELTLTALLRQALVDPASTKSTLSAGYDTPAIRKDVAELLAQLARAGHKKSATAASAGSSGNRWRALRSRRPSWRAWPRAWPPAAPSPTAWRAPWMRETAAWKRAS